MFWINCGFVSIQSWHDTETIIILTSAISIHINSCKISISIPIITCQYQAININSCINQDSHKIIPWCVTLKPQDQHVRPHGRQRDGGATGGATSTEWNSSGCIGMYWIWWLYIRYSNLLALRILTYHPRESSGSFWRPGWILTIFYLHCTWNVRYCT